MTIAIKDELTALIPPLRRFAYSLTGSAADADDLLQNTLLKLLNKGAPDDVDLLKWAFRVCRNIWIDEYRAQKVRAAAANDPMLTDTQTVDGDREVYNQIRLREVNQAMDQLSEDQRAIMSLVAIEGMSYKEVSQALDIPLGTVMSRLARARTALAGYLKIDSAGVSA